MIFDFKLTIADEEMNVVYIAECKEYKRLCDEYTKQKHFMDSYISIFDDDYEDNEQELQSIRKYRNEAAHNVMTWFIPELDALLRKD